MAGPEDLLNLDKSEEADRRHQKRLMYQVDGQGVSSKEAERSRWTVTKKVWDGKSARVIWIERTTQEDAQ